MQVRFAVIADYCNRTAEGKLNIMGIFGTIMSHEFPASHPNLHLVVGCFASPLDYGKQYDSVIQFRDADGAKLNEMKFPVKVQPVEEANFNFNLRNLPIPGPGDYVFDIAIGDCRTQVPVQARRAGKGKGKGKGRGKGKQD